MYKNHRRLKHPDMTPRRILLPYSLWQRLIILPVVLMMFGSLSGQDTLAPAFIVAGIANVIIQNGTVCDLVLSAIPTNSSPSTADSVWITNAVQGIEVGRRFKAFGEREFTITLNVSMSHPPDPAPNWTIDEPFDVIARVGTLGRMLDTLSNTLYDSQVTMNKVTGPNWVGNFNNYTYTGNVKFVRGSTAGHVVITFRTKNQYGIANWNDIAIPFVVEGPLDENVPILGETTQPQVPYMVLHDPPGDQSTATLTENSTVCRTMEETYANDESTTGFGTLRLGFKASVGFVYTFELETYVEFSASVETGTMQVESNTSTTCISTSQSITTSGLYPTADNQTLFIGYGMDMYYAVTDNLQFINCGYVIDSSLIFLPKEGSERQFVYTTKDIQDAIDELQDSMVLFTTAEDSAFATYQQDVWQQVLDLNEYNKANPGNFDPPYSPQMLFDGAEFDDQQSVTVSSGQSINIDYYLDSDLGILGYLNAGGSGFSMGVKFSTKRRYGSTISNEVSTGQTISFHLEDDDAGEFLEIAIYRDSMYGTPIFELLPTSKSSCPYEGAIRRDVPTMRASYCTREGPYGSHIFIDNVDPTIGTQTIVYVEICNQSESNETRALSWDVYNNLNSLGFQLNGDPPVMDLGNMAASSCDTFQLILEKVNINTVYDNLLFRLFPSCYANDPTLETLEAAEGDSIVINITYGSDGNYPFGDRDCDGIVNIRDCSDTLTINSVAGVLFGEYKATSKIILGGANYGSGGQNITFNAPFVQMMGNATLPDSTTIRIMPDGCIEE